MGWTAQYFTTIIIEGSTPNTGIFIYVPAPGPGTLVGSWAAQAGTDQFGNIYPAGLNVTQGILSGVLIQNSQILASTLIGAILQSPQLTNPTIAGGTSTETTITFDSGGGSLLAYTSSVTVVDQTVNGQYQITFPAGVQSAKIECWGADAGGGGGNSSEGGEGGGAGEYACEPLYPVNPSNTYFYNVGAAGSPGVTGQAGTSGTDSFFDGTGVYANAGDAGGNFVGGAGGTGSVNTIHHNGGNGGNAQGGITASAGGGGRAGSTGAGGNGGQPTSNSSPGAGGAAGSGTGGHAGGAGVVAAANGNAPGGGAGAGNAVTNHSKQYHASSTTSYYGSDGGDPNAIRTTGTFYQGGETASGGSFNGTQKSMIMWPYSQIESDLSGATIDSITVRLNNLHSWYNSGLSVALGYTNNTSPPSSYNGSQTGIGTFSMGEGATKTFNLPNSYGTALQSGAARTMIVGPGAGSFNLNYYGYFYGAGGSNQSNPMLTINYHTGTGNTVAGSGQDGEVKITYTSGNVLEASLSPVAFTDGFGNSVPAGLGQLLPSGQYSRVSAAATDNTNFTVTTTGTNVQMSNLWNIPAGDAKVGTTYILTAWGTGTMGTTQEQFNFFARFNGVSGTSIANTDQGGTFCPISTGFHWYYRIEVIVTATGSSGTVTSNGLVIFSEAVATTPTNTETAAQSSTGIAFNSTIANTLGLFGSWNAGPAASTITAFGSRLERAGP